MEINHFSHDHPLLLSQEKHNKDFSCGVCGEHIFGLSYCCPVCPYVLHKWCSDLPRELFSCKLHLLDHPLVLTPQRLSTSDPSIPTFCKACSVPINISAFSYTCKATECSISLHVECASFPKPLSTGFQRYDNTNKLVFLHDGWFSQFKTGTHNCYLCGVGDTSFLLHSLTSDTFHHIQCEMLPPTVKHHAHRHDLVLRPPLQENEEYTEFFCDLCEKERDPKDPIYYCEGCELVAHIGCGVTGSDLPIQNMIGTSPVYGSSKTAGEVVEETIEEEGGEEDEDEDEDEVGNKIHKHSLVLRNIRRRQIGTCCIGCTACIFGLTYYCESCRFYLHKRCAKLSPLIEYSKHLDHGPLVLFRRIESTHPWDKRCRFCGNSFGGDYYRCGKCDFVVHGLCAMLPNDLNHPSHEHTLTASLHDPVERLYNRKYNCRYTNECFVLPTRYDESPQCRACRYPCQGVTLECKSCDYHLHVHCFLLPQTGKHITHRHNLSLTYTYEEDPTALEFFCDCCEKPRTPNRWVYRCLDPKCDIVAHVNCVVPYPLLTTSKGQN